MAWSSPVRRSSSPLLTCTVWVRGVLSVSTLCIRISQKFIFFSLSHIYSLWIFMSLLSARHGGGQDALSCGHGGVWAVQAQWQAQTEPFKGDTSSFQVDFIPLSSSNHFFSFRKEFIPDIAAGTTRGNLVSKTKLTYLPLLMDFLQVCFSSQVLGSFSVSSVCHLAPPRHWWCPCWPPCPPPDWLPPRPGFRSYILYWRHYTRLQAEGSFTEIFSGNNYFRPKIGGR